MPQHSDTATMTNGPGPATVVDSDDEPLDVDTAMREADQAGVIQWLADRVTIDRMPLTGDGQLLDALGHAAQRRAAGPRAPVAFVVSYSPDTGIRVVSSSMTAGWISICCWVSSPRFGVSTPTCSLPGSSTTRSPRSWCSWVICSAWSTAAVTWIANMAPAV